ncbi:carbohydrate-binding protein [Gramella sp. BOM4]|nr:carbohydrate-binding protein [Christiangramia bathymodioli]
MKNLISNILVPGALLLSGISVSAQNPLIQDQFTADPSARVFNGKIYIYPSHDIVPPEGEGRADWFNMEDYHVFSSEDLTNWTDHGVILDQKDVPWADSKAYSMWAPDAIEKGGKYYLYFPTRQKAAKDGEAGFSIGVAIAESPEGPFLPQDQSIEGVKGIDPNVFIDADGQTYLYWSRDKIYGAKLKDNMLELASEPMIFEVPKKGHIEGPWLFERKGTYYLTYPHVANNTERLEYATSDNPLGPFDHRGVIMDESPTGVWTNHHSIVDYKHQWYLFYHHADFSPDFDKLRSIRADSLFFEDNGTIQKVEPTFRGVGIVQANDKIQIDRFSEKSERASIAFNDTENTFEGWHIVLNEPGSWVRFNSVEMEGALEQIDLRFDAKAESTLEVRLDAEDGPLLAEIDFSESSGFKNEKFNIQKFRSGVHDLFFILRKGNLKIDWVRFE